MRPVGAELKLHGKSGHHPQHEIDAKDAGPEARRLVVNLVVAAQRESLYDNDQGSKTHGELWEEVMKGDRERKMQPMNQECAIHTRSLAVLLNRSPRPTGIVDRT